MKKEDCPKLVTEPLIIRLENHVVKTGKTFNDIARDLNKIFTDARFSGQQIANLINGKSSGNGTTWNMIKYYLSKK